MVVKGEDRECIDEPGANLGLSFDHLSSILKKVKPKISCIASGLSGSFDFGFGWIAPPLIHGFVKIYYGDYPILLTELRESQH